MRKKVKTTSAGLVIICLTLILASGIVAAASEETYPTRPVEILVPYPPGSSVDFMSRLISDIGIKYLKQPMVVINKPGANGSVAAADVISSKPDGYKILMTSNIFFATTVKMQKVPFNPEDLVPLACFFEYKEGIVVRADSPWKTLKELVEYAEKNPNKLKIGHTGRGTAAHLPLVEIFKNAQIIEVPTRGSRERIPALLGGHIDAGVLTYQPTKSHIQAGKLRLLVVFSDRRYRNIPDVPDLLELGYPDVAKIKASNGLFIHKDAPQEAKAALIDLCNKVYQDPEFKKRIQTFGEEITFGGPDYMQKTIDDAKEIGIPLLKKLGLYKE